MMNIIYIHKDLIQRQPPDISTLFILRELGYEVSLITCGANDEILKKISDRDIKVHILPNCVGGASLLSKLSQYARFTQAVKRIVNEYPIDTVLWLEGAQTIFCLKNYLKKRRYILQIQELWERNQRFLSAIGKVIGHAEVVFMPEFSRSSLYQVWFRLEKRPTVLPNKPYFIPSESELEELKSKYPQYVSLFTQKKVILYQGHISKDRDLSAYVQAVKELGDNYCFVMMGHDHGVLSHYREIDPDIVHIDFISAPDYLLMTSMAYIGVLGYSPICENNIFCAPNKIYEYSAFGLPLLCNDIPGLYFLTTQYGAGKVVCDRDSIAIKQAIIDIENNYQTYSEGARRLFDSVDNKETIRCALSEKGMCPWWLKDKKDGL